MPCQLAIWPAPDLQPTTNTFTLVNDLHKTDERCSVAFGPAADQLQLGTTGLSQIIQLLVLLLFSPEAAPAGKTLPLLIS